jgi:two-component system chemotaxis response regulator CheY
MSKKILTVDDSKTMREMVSFTLKSAGYDVLEAVDGQAALAALGGAPVDAIITDLNMPNMNGFELIRSLRSNPAYKFTPILMLTTESEGSKKEEGKAAGATGWIVKPFNPEKLVEVVQKVCPPDAKAGSAA